jgi:hypothetical protein
VPGHAPRLLDITILNPLGERRGSRQAESYRAGVTPTPPGRVGTGSGQAGAHTCHDDSDGLGSLSGRSHLSDSDDRHESRSPARAVTVTIMMLSDDLL